MSRGDLDRRLGRWWSRLLALVPLGAAAVLTVSSLRNLDEFDGVADYLGTGLLIVCFAAPGVWLWRRKEKLSDSLDQ